jgi:glycosyltransferase involved in cell wall biosynthesis
MNGNADPLVSVVIPTYNHARYLGRALQSVLNQTYANWEAIVIDNHSTDNTDEVLASFADPRITYLKIYNNGVIAASRNAGIHAAKGEWIAFLDSDDWWKVDKLRVCFENVNEGVDLAYHDLEVVTNPPRLFRKKLNGRQVKTPVLSDLLARGNAIVTSSTLVRKKLLNRIGGMNENPNMVAAEDYNTWLRIATLTNGFKYIPKCLGFYQFHSQGVSRKDMSGPFRQATAEFSGALNENEKIKLESFIRYAKGRFDYLAGNYAQAHNDLVYSLKNGRFKVKIKSGVMLIACWANKSLFWLR